MVTVQIGQERKSLTEIDEGWLFQQIGARRERGGSICVEIVVKTDQLNMRLRTSNCPPSGGTNREATPDERRIFPALGAPSPQRAGFSARAADRVPASPPVARLNPGPILGRHVVEPTPCCHERRPSSATNSSSA